ncbi:MAG: hypothetical protein M3362_01905 [Acidobacteriota bacterium]|nr:hypothetical protein [Acidobacteriota bacterium]
MKIIIEGKRILIGADVLGYYSYYIAIWKRNLDHRLTMKKVLAQWATAVASLSRRGGAAYLPYDLNDQSCGFLKAELDGEEVVLTDMLVGGDGYRMNLDDLSREMYSEPRVIDSWYEENGQRHDCGSKVFGRYNAVELIGALKDAEIADA